MRHTWLFRLLQQLPYIAGLLYVLSLPGLSAAGQLVGGTVPKLSGGDLVHEIRKGGYVIYFRHGATSNFGEKDVADTDLKNCAIQRNLSDEGRAQTKAIGAVFKKLQIPISEVYSSPYCRCLETARNIFGKAIQSPALHFAIHLDSVQRANVTSQLLDLLGTVPAPATNMALISHTANLQEAVGIWPKPEGVAHIFKPESKGQFSYMGMLMPEDWTMFSSPHTGVAQAGKSSGWFAMLKQWFADTF